MNRNSMSALERRIDKLASLDIQPRLMPLSERDRTVQLSVVLILFEDRPPINDKRAMEECISNSLNAVRRHQSAIDEFKQEDFENRLCRLRRALSEMTRSGNLNPLVDPLKSRIHHLFLAPPEWFLRGPINGSPWGAVEIGGKKYGAIFSTSHWTEDDLAAWEIRHKIIKAARDRMPQIQGRSIYQKFCYAQYLTIEEKAILATLPDSPQHGIYWPSQSVE